MNQETRNFIEKHQNDDVHSLSFLTDKYPEVDMQLAVRQITGKQKTKPKIPTFFECEILLYPVKLSLEQSSSEITARHKSYSCEGNILLDLTGGFGVDSYFFSFNFEKVIYVERQKELCELAKHNFKALQRHNIEVINDIAESFLESTSKIDWIYIDPARRSESGQKVVLLSDCEPNVIQISEKLFSKSENILIKLSPMIDLVSVMRDLPQTSEIHIVAVENECKEILVFLKKQQSKEVQIKTVNFSKKTRVEQFDFVFSQENSAEVSYTNTLKTFLYEPNAAIMKSGAFKSVAHYFNLEKLNINSHLYTSGQFESNFPGRIFKIESTFDFSKESLKKFNSDIKKANLAVRNFPLTVNDLRKKLKLSEGGEDYIFATTLNNGKKILIHCKKAEIQ